MCAPGSKQWRKVSRYLRLFSAMIFIAYYVNFFIYSEIAYLLHGSIPHYAPAQWRMTAEAADEVTAVQEYVASLATHDLCCADAAHAVAAFDLASPYVHDIATGIVDWSSFLSPAQHHIWYLVHSTPLSWIYLPAPHSLPLPIVQVMPRRSIFQQDFAGEASEPCRDPWPQALAEGMDPTALLLQLSLAPARAECGS